MRRAPNAIPYAILIAALAACTLATGASGADLELPVPEAVVYPGESPLRTGVRTRPFRVKNAKLHLYVADRDTLADRVARRTLVAGRPIKRADLKAADAVEAGSEVRLVFREAGLTITGRGRALAAAGPGETVRVRNTDSGRTISGRVDANGTVEVRP